MAGFWEDTREPYQPKATWALGPDGVLVVGCPSTYTFDVLAPGGSVTRVARSWSPVHPTDEQRDFTRKYGGAALPRDLPAYARIVVPGDGRVWVRPDLPLVHEPLEPEVAERYGIDHTFVLSSEAVFDLFTYDGDWLATVRLPDQARYSGFPTEPSAVFRGDTCGWSPRRPGRPVVGYRSTGPAATRPADCEEVPCAAP